MIAESVNSADSSLKDLYSRNFLELILDSGIQFIDYEAQVDWDNDDDLRVKRYRKGIFTAMREGGCKIRLEPDQTGEYLINPFNPANKMAAIDADADDCVDTKDSLRLFNGIWLPVPFYSLQREEGPFNWVRCRIVNLAKFQHDGSDLSRGLYHVTFAFDTSSSKRADDNYFCPNKTDANNGSIFSFRYGKEASLFLKGFADGSAWVDNWCHSVFKDIYRIINPHLLDSQFNDLCRSKIWQAHYLNLLAFLKGFVDPKPVKLKLAFDGANDACVDVSLVLDVGNSRTCGVLVEKNSSAQPSDQFASDLKILQLRDLNAAECVFEGSFSSRIEFQQANFDYNECSAKSGRLDAFVWPSLVRVGNEADRLSAKSSGNDGDTGLNSPKRYLWQQNSANGNKEWQFNANSYQIPLLILDEGDNLNRSFYDAVKVLKSASYYPVNRFLNSSGEAVFAASGETSRMQANYSGKSAMTFMLMEIILQAVLQMNSLTHRFKSGDYSLPRRLKHLVLTTPPSMPDQEREIYRSCAYQALGVLWKSLGYDLNPPQVFGKAGNDVDANFKYLKVLPPLPQVLLKWDETLSSQFVYLYNETKEKYGGACKDFLEDLRRRDALGRFGEILQDPSGRELASARIASIDVGGGTTDLVIADYSFVKDSGNQSDDMKIREILREGFKVAGDDIVKEIIQSEILDKIKGSFYVDDPKTLNGDSDDLLSLAFGRKGSGSTQDKKRRVQAVLQILVKTAYRIINHLEALDGLVDGIDSVIVQGTIEDFILCRERCSERSAALKEDGRKVYPYPDLEAVDFVNGKLGKAIKDFDIMKFELTFDACALNRRFRLSSNEFGICAMLNTLNSIVNAYRCDVLLLTGRPTKIPGLRGLIESGSALSLQRIVSMHDYKCGKWYPLTSGRYGRIGDSKTTVAVGALLGCIKTNDSRRLINFRIDPNLIPPNPAMRFFGPLDAKNLLGADEVKYRFETRFERQNRPFAQNAEDTAIFIDKNSDDFKSSFKNPLSEALALGYRQFDNQNYPASRLYVLDRLRPDELGEVRYIKRALGLKLPSSLDLFDKNQLDRVKILLEQIRNESCRESCFNALAKASSEACGIESSQEFIGMKAKLEAALHEKADLAAKQTIKEPEVSLVNRLFGGLKKAKAKRNEELRAFKDNYSFEHYQEEVLAPLAQFAQQCAQKISSTCLRSLALGLIDNIEQEKNRALDKLRQIQTVKGEFEIKFEAVNGSEEEVSRSLDYLRRSGVEVPTIAGIKLAEVRLKGGTDCSDYVRLKLKTLAEDEYWTNTGVIVRGN